MTATDRDALPPGHSNGAQSHPWWANAVVYQVYPRSFQDSNADGFGDLVGIISRLPYLAELGVDVLWLSPVFVSPQEDNGYDIADYQAIDPMFGTLADMDALIVATHELGIKIVLDLVANHTSDEHAWFQASRTSEAEYADFYWWAPARPGTVPGTPGAEPNDWGSLFGGPAWTYDEQRGQYYLHLFSPKQPDLNWENPRVREAIFAMMNWWMNRGVDGFRMDVITLISKRVDDLGRLPGTAGSDVPTLQAGPDGFSSAVPFSADGPRLDEYLAQMRREVFDGRDGALTIGEALGVSSPRAAEITDPQRGELDMLFLFDHTGIDQGGPAGKFSVRPWKVSDLRGVFERYERDTAEHGWPSLYFCNHDQPRVVSRWGNDSTPALRVRSAKALALLLHLHRGTPFIYQGEELGMTNAGYTSLVQYRDLESVNLYAQLVHHAGTVSHEEMMQGLAAMGRDNARTPMQWDDSAYAGFTSTRGNGPWIDVNDNYVELNAQAQRTDPDSVFSFYRQLIHLRHSEPVVAIGDWQAVDTDTEVYAFTRRLGAQALLVVVNLSGEAVALPPTSSELIGEPDPSRILIANDSDDDVVAALAAGRLEPWSAVAYQIAQEAQA
ncbi:MULTISPECIES: alpha-glucosidase [Actinomyces]|uniref:Alpha-glucosidase n=1 Tax=Actinomyces respiraculi TaxID=2744574 RepID=A0A7T0LK42_9ACTO|nr:MULTISPECIES: alpha-glucosidase [Actinomyces]QPL04638.1 alpha-glucosidase [Actinomyces respiraculi]